MVSLVGRTHQPPFRHIALNCFFRFPTGSPPPPAICLGAGVLFYFVGLALFLISSDTQQR